MSYKKSKFQWVIHESGQSSYWEKVDSEVVLLSGDDDEWPHDRLLLYRA